MTEELFAESEDTLSSGEESLKSLRSSSASSG